jgi:hypothetical protein
MTSGSRITAVLATEEHAEAIAAFYRKVWDPSATTESALTATRLGAAQNVAAPGVPTPIALVLAGSEVLGYCGSIPQRIWDGERERPAYWVKGLMVLPEYRNGPIGYLAVKELTRHLDCATVLTVAPAARRLFAALGYVDLGAVDNWIKPLRPGVIANQLDLDALGFSLPPRLGSAVRAARAAGVARLAAEAAGLVINSLSRIARLGTSHFDTSSQGMPSATDLNSLWEKTRAGLTATPVRDGIYLRMRFGGDTDQGSNPYNFVTTREKGALLGFGAVRKPRATSDPRLGGIRVATASEVVFPKGRADAGLATLGAIERVGRSIGADALTCMTSHATLTTLLRGQGYIRLGGNVHFFLRDVGGTGHWPSDLASWWLGRGDGESDAVF